MTIQKWKQSFWMETKITVKVTDENRRETTEFIPQQNSNNPKESMLSIFRRIVELDTLYKFHECKEKRSSVKSLQQLYSVPFEIKTGTFNALISWKPYRKHANKCLEMTRSKNKLSGWRNQHFRVCPERFVQENMEGWMELSCKLTMQWLGVHHKNPSLRK